MDKKGKISTIGDVSSMCGKYWNDKIQVVTGNRKGHVMGFQVNDGRLEKVFDQKVGDGNITKVDVFESSFIASMENGNVVIGSIAQPEAFKVLGAYMV